MLRPRWWLLLALGLLSVVAIPPALRVEIDPGTSGWIDGQGPAATALAAVEDRFGRQDGFLIALFAPDVLAPEAVAWQRTMATAAAALPGVAMVESLATAKDVVVDDQGPAPVPLLEQPRERIVAHPIYRGLLLAADGTAAAIFARLDRTVDDRASITLEDGLRRLLRDHPAPAGSTALLGGLPIQQHAIGRAVARDQMLTVPLTVAFLTLVLVIVIPSWRAIAATLAGVGSALAWTFASFSLAGRQLDALLGLLPPLVLGIGVATALHLIRALAQAVVAGHPRPRRAALGRLRLPLTLATLTALAGVGGLWLGAVPAVRGFAPWAMLAVVLGTLLPVLWLLAVTPFLPPTDWTRIAHGPWGDGLGRRLAELAQRAAALRLPILGITAAAMLLAAGWCFRLRADADFVHALPAWDPARQAHERIDRELTGTLGMDLLIDLGHGPLAGDFRALAALEERVRREPTVVQAMSLGDILALVQAHGDARPSQAILDDLRLGATAVIGQFLGRSLGPGKERTTLRLMARQRDGSVADAADAARRLAADAAATFPGAAVTVASAALLLDETTARLLPATAQGLAASKIAVVLLLLLFLRSWRLSLVAMVLAGLPLLFTYAAIPALGWPLDIGVSMIACIALGIVMNDTVHLVHALHHHGLEAAYRRVGPTVALAGVVLALAFSACDLGGFSYTRRFGVLLALAFTSGLVINLLLAPALSHLLPPPQKSEP